MIRRHLNFNLSFLILLITIFAVSLFQGCQSVPTAVQEAEKKPVVKEPAIKKSAIKETPVAEETELDNAEYSSLSIPKGKVKLSHGIFRTKAAKGSHSETIVALTHHIASGKVDNKEGSAVILVTTTGGKGFYYDLAFMVKEKGKQKNIATSPLGEQVKIKSFGIDKGQIIVHMLKHKKKDPICCPTLDVTQRYELKGNKLVLVSGK
jgi:hypothetical protein